MYGESTLRAALDQFFGTEKYHYNPLYPKMNYTDGVQFFANNAGNGAYWLLDIIGTEIFEIHRKGEEFIHIRLIVSGEKAEIVADDGNDNVLFRRSIEFTDCPSGEWRFFLENNVLMLPGER